MTNAARLLKLLIRVCGVAALLLGLAFWTGHLFSWLPVHTLLGVVLVLALWAMAALAFFAHAGRALAAFAAAWGLGVVMFGRMQVGLLPGDLHWIIALAHLVAGGIAMAFGAVLAGAIERSARRIGPRTSRTPPPAVAGTGS